MSFELLLVEDGPAHARLMPEAFRDLDRTIHVRGVADGVEAWAFLRRQWIHDHAPRPDLILLDLNLPEIDGRDLLSCIKGNDDLKSIPVIIVTASDAEVDVVTGCQHGANSYVK